jgi:hypothetical protein
MCALFFTYKCGGQLFSPPDSVLKGSCDVRHYLFVITKEFSYINLYVHVNISECVLILI